MSKYGHRTHNWFEAVINKLGGEEAAERFLRDELTISEPMRPWVESDGVIYFTVTSDGKSGPEWIAHFEKKGDRVGDYARQLLCHRDFRPTNGVTYQVAVLKGMFFSDKDRVTKKIRSEADRRKWNRPKAEIACLIRDKFTDTEIELMGLTCIITMHEPRKDSDDHPSLFGVDCVGRGRWLRAECDDPDRQWGRERGFAFVVSQMSTWELESLITSDS